MNRATIAKRIFMLLIAVLAFGTTGCVQEALVEPVGTITGRIIVPPGKDPLGIKITVAGNKAITAYVNELGYYKLEFRKGGRYLLIARSRYYDADFAWVDASVDETNKAPDIILSEKIISEAKFLASIVDFPDATAFQIKSISPTWATSSVLMYDDGTHGDKYANDGVFSTRVANLASGYQTYQLTWTGPEGDKTENDPHQEDALDGKSLIVVPAPLTKIAQGKVTSTLTKVTFSEIALMSKGGARKIFLNADGTYSMPMEGNGREYLVFRSPVFHIRTRPVDLSTVTIYDVPDLALAAKGSGEALFMLVKSDFPEVTNPTLVADFTNWQPQPMYDDGTHGDEAAGDGVYSLLKTGVSPGYHKYAFNVTPTAQVRDPYQESGDSQYSILNVK